MIRFRAGWRRSAIVLLVFAAGSPAFAAGINCLQVVSSDTEKAICASKDLRELDNGLAALYRKLSRIQPRQRKSLERAQREWLKQRDQCGADKSCLSDRYRERMGALEKPLSAALAYRPDAIDRQALEELRQAVEAARQSDPAFALKRGLEPFRIKTGLTEFWNDRTGDDVPAHFPMVRPAGMTPDEWHALRISGIDGGGENGSASWTLLHIDGRAQRDLVVNTYPGGTSLSDISNVFQRKGDRFVDDGPFYGENGRGANQSVIWINVRGRTYAAYINSTYGEDNVYLLRPLTGIGQVPKLTVRYHYQLSVPRVQEADGGKSSTTLDESVYVALTHAPDSIG